METYATRRCERLVGLPDVPISAVDDQPSTSKSNNASTNGIALTAAW